jgi:hypothetical protein
MCTDPAHNECHPVARTAHVRQAGVRPAVPAFSAERRRRQAQRFRARAARIASPSRWRPPARSREMRAHRGAKRSGNLIHDLLMGRVIF